MLAIKVLVIFVIAFNLIAEGQAVDPSDRGNAPKMSWTENCPDSCEECLEVEFQSGEKDTACLNPLYDDNDCLFGGNIMGKGTKAGQVVVSSSECLKTGNMDDIEVSFMDERSPVAKMFKP